AHRPVAGRVRSSGERGPAGPACDHRIRANEPGDDQVYEAHRREPGTVEADHREQSGRRREGRRIAKSGGTIRPAGGQRTTFMTLALALEPRAWPALMGEED